MTEPLTFLDFFSGVGGFRKGFELCGMVCKGHIHGAVSLLTLAAKAISGV